MTKVTRMRPLIFQISKQKLLTIFLALVVTITRCVLYIN